MSTNTDPVRQRMAAANPVRTEAEPPGEVMTAAVLLDVIDDRSGAMTHKADSQGQGTSTATRSVRRNWAAAFAAGFAVVLVIGIAFGLLNRGGDPLDVITPVTTTTPTSVPNATPTSIPDMAPLITINADQIIHPLPGDDAHGVAVANGALWVTTEAGVVRWDLEGGDPELFTSDDGLPFDDGFHGQVVVAPDGTVWVSPYYPQDLVTFDGTRWSEPVGYDQIDIVNPRCSPDDECSNPITVMAAGPNGVLFLGLGDGTLVEFDGADWSVHPTPVDAADMAVAADGTLWVAGSDEVSAYDGDTWTRFTTADGLPSGRINTVDVAPNGDVWVGTTDSFDGDASGGVARFDGNTWTVFDEADGLYDNNVVALTIGADGTVWAVHSATDDLYSAEEVATGGISRLDGTAWSTTTIADVEIGFGWGGAAADDTGSLWITSHWGVVGFDGTEATVLRVPEGTRPRIEVPHAVIEGGEDILATTSAKPTPPVATCPTGTDPNGSGPADQARPLSGYSLRAAMDRQSGRVVTVDRRAINGGGPAIETWTFDVCTNTWTLMSQPEFHRVASYDDLPYVLVYDADSDVVVAIGTSVAAYDVDTDTWEWHGETPLDTGPETDSEARAIYDPVSGLIVVRDIASSEMWAYDVDTDTWTQIEQGPISPPYDFYAQLHAYDASTDRIVLYLSGYGSSAWGGSGTEMTWTFDLRAGEWTTEDTVTPGLGLDGFILPTGKAAYDEAVQRTVITGDGVVGGYDAVRHEWEMLWANPGQSDADGIGRGLHNRYGDTVVYDPVNDRIVVIGGEARMLDEDPIWVSMNDVWAFDAGTGTWTELLAPSDP